MPRIRPASADDARNVAIALDHLRAARALLRQAGAPRAARAARRALSSAEGAARHVAHRLHRMPT